MSQMIRVVKHDVITVLHLANPPVNALGTGMRQLLEQLLQQAYDDPDVHAIVIASDLTLFCGGADIQEFLPEDPAATPSVDMWIQPDLPWLCQFVDDSPKLVIASINGAAMGGAVELSLACDYRIGGPNAALGLPEIKLGLLPGAGGTQRLPRVVGVRAAADIILSGDPVDAQTAAEIGLLDHLVSITQDFPEATLRYVRELLKLYAPSRPSGATKVAVSDQDLVFLNSLKNEVERSTVGQIAPAACVEAIEDSTVLNLEDGLTKEKATFIELLKTPQARAKIHLFLLNGKHAEYRVYQKRRRHVRSAPSVVVGAGTMGTGITVALVNAGYPVTLMDMAEPSVSRGVATINSYFSREVEKGRITTEVAAERMALIETTIEFSSLSSADLVIEAVFENLEVKRSVFEQLDKICKPGAIMATNTSTLDVNKIAAVTNRPESVVGLHFFSPANVMRLLEIVRADATAPEVIKTTQALATRIGKLPVVVNVCFGFVGNRMLEPYLREASRLLLEGASAEDIDGVITEFGFPMGPLSMVDLAGIDVGYQVRESRRKAFSFDPSYQIIQDHLHEQGKMGQKTAHGFYLYDGRTRITDPELKATCQSIANSLGIVQREIDRKEILERLLFPLVNEGYQLLDEGIAYRSGDCDLIWVNGYGFPAWRGGPLRYAEEIGPERVLEGLHRYRKQLGEYGENWFQPAKLLVETVAKDSR